MRDAPVPELSLVDQLFVGPDGLVEGRFGIEAMALMEIDVVRAKTPERSLDALDDVLAREPAIVGRLAHREETFGRDDELVAGQGGDRIAEGALGLPLGVDVGGIEEIDAELEGMGDESCRLAPVDLRAEGQPRAEG